MIKRIKPIKTTTTKRKKMPGSGRKKGTPNKNSAVVRLALDKSNYNLVQELIDTLNKIQDPSEKVDVILQVFPYVYPKLKEIEQLPEQQASEDTKITTEDLVILATLEKNRGKKKDD